MCIWWSQSQFYAGVVAARGRWDYMNVYVHWGNAVKQSGKCPTFTVDIYFLDPRLKQGGDGTVWMSTGILNVVFSKDS